mgnify:CR=1 FL=1
MTKLKTDYAFVLLAFFLFINSSNVIADEDLSIFSPDKNLEFKLEEKDGALFFAFNHGGVSIIPISPLKMEIDGKIITNKVSVGQVALDEFKEKYSVRGVHTEAINHCNVGKVSLNSQQLDINYTLEIRVFNEGAAFRFIIPGEGERIPDESTTIHLPSKSEIWYHDLYWHYEGNHVKKYIEEVRNGEWMAPPLTVKLPDHGGYVVLSEAGLKDYAGMSFQANGNNGVVLNLGHNAPSGYPFAHDYSMEDAIRLAVPASIKGEIITPWRTISFGKDLHELVNNDLLTHLSPLPDKTYFPEGLDTEWIQPGRSVWTWLDGGERTLDGVKEFSRLAGELGFEYNIVDAFWNRWTEEDLRDLVEYSAKQGVEIWLWRHGRDVKEREERRDFFKMCQRLGVVGVKLDAFSHESKEFIDLYQACLADAAEFQLMVNFHGNNKPTGEVRAWPNEMTREGIRGLEYGRTQQSWSVHNTTLPFTRLLAGHGDYTPVVFGERRLDTSWAHQIGTAIVFTSPLLVYGSHPQALLDNPAVEIIKDIPSVWDETVVLPISNIGNVAAFARRKGEDWYLAVLNGPESKNLQLPLSFLGDGMYRATIGKDAQKHDAIKMEKAFVKCKDTLPVQMLSGGGFIVQFIKE